TTDMNAFCMHLVREINSISESLCELKFLIQHAFFANPRPESRSGANPARDRPSGDRPSRSGIPAARDGSAGRLPNRFRNTAACHHLSVIWYRRMGGGDRQYAVARRQG